MDSVPIQFIARTNGDYCASQCQFLIKMLDPKLFGRMVSSGMNMVRDGRPLRTAACLKAEEAAKESA